MNLLKSRTKKDRIHRFLLFAFLISYACFLCWLIAHINISEDESYTLNTTSRNVLGVVRQSYKFENQLPVYFLLLSFWRMVNSGIFFSRLFSALSVCISAVYIFKITKIITGKENVYWIIVLFLLNPFTVWAAFELRLYAFVVLLSSICIYSYLKFFLEEQKKYLYVFLIISLIGAYTQYFFIFLLFSLAVATIFLKGWKSFYKICLYLLPVAILFLPNLMFLSNQIDSQAAPNKFANFQKLNYVLSSPKYLTLGLNYVSNSLLYNLVRFGFLFFLILSCFKLYKNYDTWNQKLHKRFQFIVLTTMILILLFFFGVFFTDIVYDQKYMSVAFPFLILLFTIFNVFSSKISGSIYLLFSIYFIGMLIKIYRYPVNTYDYISTAKYVEKIEHREEPILIYRANIALPFKYYYQGKNQIIPLPEKVNFDSNYLSNIKDTNQLKQILKTLPPSKSFLFIADTTSVETNLNMNRKMVTEFLDSHYPVTLDTFYRGNAKGKSLRITNYIVN